MTIVPDHVDALFTLLLRYQEEHQVDDHTLWKSYLCCILAGLEGCGVPRDVVLRLADAFGEAWLTIPSVRA